MDMNFVYAPIAPTKVGRPSGSANPERDADIVTMFSSGSTLEEIGIKYQVSRQRVQQILSRYGITRINGGSVVRAKGKSLKLAEWRAAEKQKKENKQSEYFGCSYAEVLLIGHGQSPWAKSNRRGRAYIQQKRSAGYRGVAWNISFTDWWKIWSESGCWMKRGRGSGGYCMARINETLGYEPTNVKIISNKENISEGYDVVDAATRQTRAREVEPDIRLRAYFLKLCGFSRKEISNKLNLSGSTTGQYVSRGRAIYYARLNPQ